MGAGKTTVGARVRGPRRRGRSSTSTARSRSATGPIPELFEERGEPGFAASRRRSLAEVLARPDAVIALGGGAVLSAAHPRASARSVPSRSTSTSTSRGLEARARLRPAAGAARGRVPRALRVERQPVYAEAADAAAVSSRRAARRGASRERGRSRLASSSRRGPAVARRGRAGASAPSRSARGRPDAHGSCGRGGEDARGRASACGASSRSTATARSSRSAAARRPTSPASSRRRTCAGFRWVPSRRRSSGRSTPRSGARRASTSPTGKNLVGAFHCPRRSCIDPSSWPRSRRASGVRAWPRS